MIRRLLTLALLVTGLAAVPIAARPASAAPSVPNGFKLISYDAGMFEYDLTNFVTIPGTNTMLATGKSGRVTRVDITGDGMDPSDAVVTRLGTLPVFSTGDRGLLGISLAADYLTTGHVYMLYDYFVHNQQPTGRLSQFTLTGPPTAPVGIDLRSEVELLGGLPSWSPTPDLECTDSHTVGTVVTAPDGTLFVGNGDGASYCGSLDPASLEAQNLTSPRGKIFHINPDGSPVADNPFIDRPDYWAQRVFAYGFRNPYRFTLSNDVLYVGDVGWNTVEELDAVTSGVNMGWPCWEGDVTTELSSTPQCRLGGPTFPPPGVYNEPFLTWRHNNHQSAVVGGVFTPASWPNGTESRYMFGDYAQGDLFLTNHDTPFGTPGSWGSITSIQTGPGGDVYVSDIGAPGTGPGHITRIHYLLGQADNQIPTVALVSSTATGHSPLNVQFSATAADADGAITNYAWDFGDGTVANGPSLNRPSHVYSRQGTFHPVVTVTDNASPAATASATLSVVVGNSLPILSVVRPTVLFHPGDPIHIQASAVDPDGGPVQVTYQPIIHHCPSITECHAHPGAIQTSPDFVYPDHGVNSDEYYLEILVRATDSTEGVVTDSVNLFLAVLPTPPQPPSPPPVVVGNTLRYTPVNPTRLVDTRDNIKIVPNVPLSVNMSGHRAAMITVTVTNPEGTGYVRAFPCGQTNVQTSTVNFNTGQTISNVAIVAIPDDGMVCFYTLRTTDIIVDLSGWFDSDGLGYTPVNPTRLFDTRKGLPFGAGEQVSFHAGDPVPDAARALMMNLTVDHPAAAGYLRAYPCDGESNVANLNYDADQTIADFAAVKSSGGTVCFRSYANTDALADLAGYFTDDGGYNLTSIDPARLFDTRATDGFQRLEAGQEIRVDLGLPPGTVAAVLNLTAADPDAAGYVSVYPCNTPNESSSVNYVGHQTAAANMTVVKTPDPGEVCFRSYAATDLIVDLSGWFN